MIEYPKALYLRGWADLAAMVTVADKPAEAEARADGYRSLSEAAVEVVVEGDASAAPKRLGRPPKAVAE